MLQFHGARFRKCDLQMQTPADAAHWLGEKFDVDNDPKSAAEAYIKGCYEAGLEIIAITDHNFKSKKFIPYLIEAAKQLASDYDYPLTIFPGFEFTANVGQGLHVLGIFPPDRDLDEIDHVLTRCGVPTPRQKPDGGHHPSTKSLREILKEIQTRNSDGELEGIVVLPHSQSNSGIFDKEKIAEWLQISEFTNPDLYALEVPKSPSKMSKGWQKLLANGNECEAQWKRERSIACILSSDTKSIADRGKTDHVIGSRYTWMKMSQPSLEAIRQCFLDSNSRIRLSDACPDNPEFGYGFPYVQSLEISSTAFLADQKVIFSPNLNALIGGRGTGKSTFLEYLRMGLDRSDEITTNESGELKRDFEKFKSTLLGTSKLTVVYNKGQDFEEPFEIVYECGKHSVSGDSIGSISAFFPVQIFSRSQIEAMANDPAKQRLILDAPITPELATLRSQERQAVSKIQDLNTKIASAEELEKERGSLISQIRNLSGQISSIEKHLGPLQEWLEWKTAKSLLTSADTTMSLILEEVANFFPEEGYNFEQLEAGVDQTKLVNEEIKNVSALATQFAANVAAVATEARSNFEKLQNGQSRQAWLKQYNVVAATHEKAIEELKAKGIDPSEYESLLKERQTRQENLTEVEATLDEISKGRTTVGKILKEELIPIWQQQTKLRQDIADKLNQNVPKTSSGEPTVKTSIIPYGDFQDFLRALRPHLSDKRSVSESDWNMILEAVFNCAGKKNVPPSFILKEWIEASQENQPIPDFPEVLVNLSKMSVVASWISETKLNMILAQRTLDSVSVSLHRRSDDKLIGDLAGRRLSAGQKATTILSLILGYGNDPIIIDQPEDDLDNEFVYEQLVPMIRHAKERRQIIVVTHNANIPVNGDAELIVPLEIRDESGAQKLIDGKLALGSLDKKPVRAAVELILEGSVEAFKRRRERYGI